MIDRRKDCRRRVLLCASIKHHFHKSLTDCTIRNQSKDGVQLCLSETLPLPDRFELLVAGHDSPRMVELVWRYGDAVGLRFVLPAECDLSRRLADRLQAMEIENAQLRERIAECFALATLPASSLH